MMKKLIYLILVLGFVFTACDPMDEIYDTINKAIAVKDKPAMIVAHTVKAKGNVCYENRIECHFISLRACVVGRDSSGVDHFLGTFTCHIGHKNRVGTGGHDALGNFCFIDICTVWYILIAGKPSHPMGRQLPVELFLENPTIGFLL